jgi:hypothetical protein
VRERALVYLPGGFDALSHVPPTYVASEHLFPPEHEGSGERKEESSETGSCDHYWLAGKFLNLP